MEQSSKYQPEVDAAEPILPSPAYVALSDILGKAGIFLFPSDRNLAPDAEAGEFDTASETA